MDLLVVADQADRLATEFARTAHAAGRRVRFVGVTEAAQLFTVGVNWTGEGTVQPEVPMFLRPPGSPLLRPSFDTAFHAGECTALLWAAAAFCRAPVVNRPGAWGFAGRCSPSAGLTEGRVQAGERRLEVFSRLPPEPPAGEENWCLQDLPTRTTCRWPEVPAEGGPYRARAVQRAEAYETVIVVGREGWRISAVPLEHLRLEEKSVALMARLELIFGAITWGVSEDLRQARLARADPFPHISQVQHVWAETSQALLKVLLP